MPATHSLLLLVSLASIPAVIAAGGEDAPCAGAEATFVIAAEGAADGRLELPVRPGDRGEVAITILLEAAFEEQKPTGGWALSVAHTEDSEGDDLLVLEDITTDGTFREALNGVFELTEPASDGAAQGFVSAVFATCGIAACFIGPNAEYVLAHARYRFTIPEDFGELDTSLNTAVRLRDGLQGSGQPVTNLLGADGGSLQPCTRDLEITFRLPASRPFFRGDANYDEVLDISDPVTVLRALFHGDATIRCEDAADGNDDGAIDISDAAYIFNYLFTGGPPPPPPFPEPGEDPTDGDPFDCRV